MCQRQLVRIKLSNDELFVSYFIFVDEAGIRRQRVKMQTADDP